MRKMRRLGAFCLITLILAATPVAQWTNRYPKVDGYRHHIYLEGYELPILAAGPTDPAASPDATTIAFAARGWLWLLNLESGKARRLTHGAAMDSRPVWFPDGSRIAFVRDDTRDTSIVAIDPASGQETVLVDTPALDLDPSISDDGRFLFFSSASAGDLDIWRLELADGRQERITSEDGLELKPQLASKTNLLVYLAKTRSGGDQIRVLDLETAASRTLRTDFIASQTRPALSPDGQTLAVNLPDSEGWKLWLMDIAVPGALIRLAGSSRRPLTPAWSADSKWVFYVEADENQDFSLQQVSRAGGPARTVSIRKWDWGVPTGRLIVKTHSSAGQQSLPARLHVADSQGHPLIPDRGMPRFDGQNGLTYFYSEGTVSLEVPLGRVSILASSGLSTPVASAEATLGRNEEVSVGLGLAAAFDAHEKGYYSGDHHFHLNYGGPYVLSPDTLLPILKAEDLDVATPLAANLHNRPQDLRWFDWQNSTSPIVRFGQEVRSHFLGHIGLIGIKDVFWPWFWGPGYPVYGRDDRPNQDTLGFSRRQGGVSSYVHPVSVPDPFAADPPATGGVELIADAVLGDLDSLEIACLWSDELGTSQLWYRFLNLGLLIAPSAGTDAFADFYRSMAIGTTRVYVRPDGALSWESYLSALRQGRSFVTNAPLLDFDIAGTQPGGVLAGPPRESKWQLELASALPVDKVEILVNGEVIWEGPGLDSSGRRHFEGTLNLPAAGWVAARAYGGKIQWPAMDSYPFAHTGAIWIGALGSSLPKARQSAAGDLLKALAGAEQRLAEGYGDAPIPRLKKRLLDARQKLEGYRQQ